MDWILLAAAWFLAITGARVSSAEDWPTYRHDNARSGRTRQTLVLDRLQEQWVWHSAQPVAFGAAAADGLGGTSQVGCVCFRPRLARHA